MAIETANAQAPAADPAVETRPSGRALLVVLIVSAALLMEGLDSTIIVTALPKMAQTFHTSPIAMSIGLTAYMLTVAILTPTSGWLADRFRARTVFAASICVFTIASVLCGLCQNLPAFTCARILQGMGGGLMTSVGRLIVFRSTPKPQLVRAINFMTVPMLFGPALGPPIGGFLAQYVSWRAGFFINVPIGLAGLVMVLMFIPRDGQERRRFDVTGFGLNGAALAALIYGMQSLASAGAAAHQLGAVLIAAAVPLIWFAVRHARTSEHPLIDLAPLSSATFRMTTLTASNLMRVAVGVSGFFMPLMFQVGLGLSPSVSGLLVLSHMAGDLSAKTVTTEAVRRLGFRRLLMASLAIYAVGLLTFVLFGQATPLWLIVVVLYLSGGARSFQMTGITALQFADVPQAQMSAASTLSAVSMQAVRALGVAFAALLLNVIVAVHGDAHLGLADFHIAFAVIAALAALALVAYYRLPHNAGAAVSGR